MGLDNGISLRFKNNEPRWVNKLYHYEFDGSYELAYWRKCWNIRELILAMLEEFGHKVDNETFAYTLSAKELLIISRTIKKTLLNKKCWTEHYEEGLTIWDWKSIKRGYIRQCQMCIRYAKKLMKLNPDDYVIEFYDSY